MTFLNLAFLFGLLAVSLPVAIHLLSKPRLRRINWPANRFLVKVLQKNRSRSKAEDLLLLLLRCLFVALLALLFARPAWLVPATDLPGGKEATTAVIVLDDTESMGQSDGTQTRFDLAKTKIDALLSQLAPGSSSALLLVSDRTKAVIPKPTEDLAAVRRSLAPLAPTDEGGDLYAGVQSAVDLLKNYPAHRREIFVLTDGQKAAWAELGRIRQLQDENKKEMAFHFLTLGDNGEDNLAVSNLQMAGMVAVTNQPLRYAATITNWGRSAVSKIPVKLAVDDQPPQDQGMIDRLEPGASQVINLFARFRDPGAHTVTVTIPGDRLPADDQRSVAVLVLEEVRTLVVEGTTNADPTARDGFYLSHALAPVRPDQVDKYYVKVKVGRANELDANTLSDYEVIFLSNVAQLTPLGSQKLAHYVNQGGTLVVFPGPTTDINFYNTDPAFSPLLPAKLSAVRDVPADQKALGWQSSGYEHPITSLWNDPQAGTLASVRTTRYFPLTLAPAPARLVVKYANGEPAVAEQAVGKGKVILFSSTATTAWNTLPLHPGFVPLLARIIAYATNGMAGNLNLAAGQPFSYNVDSAEGGKDLSVIRPGQTKRQIIGEAERGEEFAVLHDSDTELAGPYQLFVGDAAKPQVVFAVQGDPAESNLAQEPKTDLEPLLAQDTAAPAPDENNPAPAASTGSTHRVPGGEWWVPLAAVLLVLVLVETAAAHYFSQSK
jgi:hypothetical protein